MLPAEKNRKLPAIFLIAAQVIHEWFIRGGQHCPGRPQKGHELSGQSLVIFRRKYNGGAIIVRMRTEADALLFAH